MADLETCYFCGSAPAGALEEYAVVPAALSPSPDQQHSVVLCPTCREKLTAVMAPVVEAAGEASDGAAGDGSDVAGASSTGSAGRSAPGGGQSADAGGGSAAGAAPSSGESGPTAGGGPADGSGADPGASAGDPGASGTDAGGTGDGRDEPGVSASPADDADEADGVTLDPSDGDPAAGGEPAGPSSPAAGSGDASSSSDPGDEGGRGGGTSAPKDVADRTPSDDPRNRDEELLGRDSRAYNRVLRLLRNREFPVERHEIEEVAASAYQMDPQEVSDAIDAVLQKGLLVQEGSHLRRP